LTAFSGWIYGGRCDDSRININQKEIIMNRSVINQGGARNWCCAMLAGLVLLSWAGPVSGGEKQAVQSVAIAVGYTPGKMSVTPGGTIHVEGFTVVYMVLSANPLTNGRLTVTGNFNGDLTLDGVGSGHSSFEVGTWDLSSEVPAFTPSAAGGCWASKWESKGILGGEGAIHALGHGIAGEVEGMIYAVVGQADPDGVAAYTGWLLDPKN
jgi:hypothetical protein